ncbi:MAG: proline--tRNA ligase, partial [Coriobacteriaceae bacterium]|nr:proline--tRNA ligase [Coriobacteriaceae bacterium]
SQIFQLGTKYSEPMGATFMAEDGSEQPFEMGCYGIGVTRSLAAVVEQYNDEKGICWPISVAPAEVCVVPLQVGDDTVEPLAARIADELDAAGIETVIDDRDERPGVKFAEAELIGWPYQVVVGKRGVADGIVEFKERAGGSTTEVAIDDVVATVCDTVTAERQTYL